MNWKEFSTKATSIIDKVLDFKLSIWVVIISVAFGALLGWAIASGAIIPLLSVAIIAGVWWWKKQKGDEPMK